MINDQDLKKIFNAQKSDIPDDGFSERVVSHLPERASILPQVVMVLCVVTGLSLTIAIQGITPIFNQIGSLITAISHLQMPSITSIVTYVGGVALLGTIGYAVGRAGME